MAPVPTNTINKSNPLDVLAYQRDVARVYIMKHAQPARMGDPLSRRVSLEISEDPRGRFFTDSPIQPVVDTVTRTPGSCL